MQKRRVFYVLLVIGAIAGGLFATRAGPREPKYAGRSLSQWVKGYSYSYAIDHGRYSPQQRDAAIRAMGTDAIPFLLKWIRYETPPLKGRIYGALNAALRKIKPAWQLNDENEQLRADGAVFALISLCPNSTRAAAELAKLMDDPTASPAAKQRAANVLACIDQRSWKDPRTYRYFRQDRLE